MENTTANTPPATVIDTRPFLWAVRHTLDQALARHHDPALVADIQDGKASIRFAYDERTAILSIGAIGDDGTVTPLTAMFTLPQPHAGRGLADVMFELMEHEQPH